ncbi:MAG TPA: hypothetical protein VFQ13_14990 [Anaerolineales bacterium]|nr:hypothetical protein [Anaerolineales bacterium]
MTTIRFFSTLVLSAVLLAACAPESAPTNPPPTATETRTLTPDTLTPEPTAPAEATALPVATSRGPELHATDPTTVSLASGGLQFVEFFRFT